MLEPGAEIVYAWPSFSIYPHLAAMSGARAITVPLNDAGEHDLEAMAREVTGATRILIVCNPNNPTATGIPPAAIDAFVAELPRHVAVILDEAYVEFSTLQDPDESLDAPRPPPQPGPAAHVLEGLRAVRAPGGLRARLRGVPPRRGPRAPAVLRQRARARPRRPRRCNHEDEVERRVEQTAIERMHVESELEERGLETTDSQANFSWVSLGDRDEDEIVDGLAQRGVIVRAGARARRRRADARHLRHPRRERPLPRGAGRAALSLVYKLVQ